MNALDVRAEEREPHEHEAERAQLLWELDSARDLFTTDELHKLVTEARRIVAKRV